MAFNFDGLDVYQKALVFADEVFLTNDFPSFELYGLTLQLTKAATSICVNIAEGSNRTKKQFANYLDISRGSLLECVALLTISLKREYIAPG